MSIRSTATLAILLGISGFFLGVWFSGNPDQRSTPHPQIDDPGVAGQRGVEAAPGASPRAVIAAALAETDVLRRSPRLASVLEHLGPDEIDTVRSALRLSLGDISAADYDLFLAWWTRVDPEGAVEWTFNHSPRGYRTLAPSVSIYGWARRDPEAALRAVDASLDRLSDDSADFAIRALIRGWFDSGREDVQTYLRGLGSGMKRDIAIAAFARTLALRRGGQAAIEWAESLPEGDADEGVSPIDSPFRQKLTAFRRLAAELGRADPEAGAAFVERHRDGPFADGMMKNFAVAFLTQGGESAAKWLSKQPPADERDESLRIGFRYWLLNDRKGATRWALGATPEEEPWRVAAALQIATNIVDDDPERALAWAESIENPRARENAIVITVRRWRTRDPGAADAWLESAEVPQQTRERVLQKPRVRSGA